MFCEIVEDPWWFLEEFWWVLISFPLFFEGFKDFVGFLGWSPVASGPANSLPPNLPISLKAGLMEYTCVYTFVYVFIYLFICIYLSLPTIYIYIYML